MKSMIENGFEYGKNIEIFTRYCELDGEVVDVGSVIYTSDASKFKELFCEGEIVDVEYDEDGTEVLFIKGVGRTWLIGRMPTRDDWHMFICDYQNIIDDNTPHRRDHWSR